MEKSFTKEELDIIIEALGYKLREVREYQDHPTYEFKQAELERIDDLMNKLRAVRKTI